MTISADELLAMCPDNYAALFRDRVTQSADKVAFWVPDLSGASTEWSPLSWRQVAEQVDELSAGLIQLGLAPEERVAIVSTTRIEWVLADLAIACAAGVTTTIYPNTHQDDMEHILRDSESVLAFVENKTQLDKVLTLGEDNRGLRHILVMDDSGVDATADPRIVTWQQLRADGRKYLASHPDCLTDRLKLMKPDSLSTLIYTSGTTGLSKGVELTHQCWTYEAITLNWMNFVNEDDLLYLWLPLSHVFGRDLLAVQLGIGFSAAVDGRVDRIVQGMGEVRPTLLVGVPRIFEKVRAVVMTMSHGIAGQISRWAFAVGRESRPYRLAGRPLPWTVRLRYGLAERLVFSRLKASLGGRMRFMISGSAKLSSQVQEWFYSAGITVVEGYGLTETSAITCVNLPAVPRFGTVGPAIPGVEIRIADDHELLVRGPTVARGYHNLPEATADAWRDGWFHTGDLGIMDADGYVTITDRKKDLIKTSNGKYVAPQVVESVIMANIPYVSQVLVVGEGRPYVVAVVALDPESLMKWGANHGHPEMSYAELSQLPEIRESIDRFMRRANEHLARSETVKRYAILDHELSLDAEELTPSLKIRRDIVLNKYADVIDGLYAQQGRSDLTEAAEG